jgi:hypothetical protein
VPSGPVAILSPGDRGISDGDAWRHSALHARQPGWLSFRNQPEGIAMKIEYCFLSLETGKSSLTVLSELLHKSEVGILQRIEETHNGFVVAIRV